MPAIPHVCRRGAVYYWRRRLPRRVGLATHLVVSLRTTNQATARVLAARLDDEMLRMRQSAVERGDYLLTPDQMKAMFGLVARKHLAKLERVAAFDRLQANFDVAVSRSRDRSMAYAFRLLATHGPNVEITQATRGELGKEGLTDNEIDGVSSYLDLLRRHGLHVDTRDRLKDLLKEVDGAPTSINLSIAQTVRHRAMAAALLDTKDRWGLSASLDEVLLDGIVRGEASIGPARGAIAPTPERVSLPPNSSAPARPQPSPEPAPEPPPAPSRPLDPIIKSPPPKISGRPVDVAETLLRGPMANVDEKSKRQVRSEAKLLNKFLIEDHGITDLRDLEQRHLAAFFSFLQSDLYLHYGKSEQDEGRSLRELRQLWSAKNSALRGVDKPTAERYANHLKQLFKAGTAAGIAINRDLTFDGLIANKEKPVRARNARPTITVAQSQSLFQQPPFVGCRSWNNIASPDLTFSTARSISRHCSSSMAESAGKRSAVHSSTT